jgi:hypothetical protein
MTQAVMRFRQGGFISHPEDDPEDEEDQYVPPQNKEYY